MKEKKTATKHSVKKPVAKKTIRRPAKTKKADNSAQVNIVGLHNLRSPFGSRKKKKLLGRGSSSGHGKTSTRGSKGQTSRAGRHFYLGFEGGQSPLIRRMPKRGFVSNFKKNYQIINLEDLNRVKETTITPAVLKASGLIASESGLIKVLGNGSIKNAVTIQAHAFSKHASEAIAGAGGKVEIIKV